MESALRTGEESAKANVVDRLLIPRVHPQVIEAISMSAMPSSLKALGILEFFSVTGAIIAADAAAKAASVSLIEIRLGTGIGGKSLSLLPGMWVQWKKVWRQGQKQRKAAELWWRRS